jgi:Flp pilus assembly protein TadD
VHLGRYQDAISCAKLACTIVPSNSLGYADLGFAYLKQGDFVLAAEGFEKARALGDDSVETLELYAASLTQEALELEIVGERAG